MSEDKTVKEEKFKFYLTYTDAELGINYLVLPLDVECGTPPNSVEKSLKLSEFSYQENVTYPEISVNISFRLKKFARKDLTDSYIETAYIKIN